MSKQTRGRPIFARYYARFSPQMDRELAPYRDQMLAGLSGQVLELGAGTGATFGHYPAEVTGVLAIEPEPYLRSHAERAAASASVSVEVVDGLADDLPAAEETCDAAVVSLVLCSVPDQRRALRELHRVLRPGGQLRFLEHVRADTPRMRTVQRIVDATVWPVAGAGRWLSHRPRHGRGDR